MIPVETTVVRPSDLRVGAIMEFTAPTGEVLQRPLDINIDTRQFVAELDIVSAPGAGPLLLQEVTGQATPPVVMVLTFGMTPAVGNLLILCLNTPTTVTTDMTALGYTRIVGGVSNGAMYYKIAGASEPSTLSIACGTSGTRMTGVWMEWDQMHATPVDVFSSNPPSGDVSSKSSGITATTAQANELAIAMFYFGSGTQISGVSWSNGFTMEAAQRNLTVGSGYLGATGQIETTMSWTSGLRNMGGHIVTFKAAQAAPAPPSPSQYFSRFVVCEVEAADPLPDSHFGEGGTTRHKRHRYVETARGHRKLVTYWV